MKNFTSNSQKIGQLGEDIACKFLMKHDFSVLERNYTKKWGEIDIIAEKNGKRYFIEVKSTSVSSIDYIKNLERKEDGHINRPEENMHPWKLKRLRRVVETYLISKRLGTIEWRFDLIVVYMDIDKRQAHVKLIENVIL